MAFLSGLANKATAVVKEQSDKVQGLKDSVNDKVDQVKKTVDEAIKKITDVFEIPDFFSSPDPAPEPEPESHSISIPEGNEAAEEEEKRKQEENRKRLEELRRKQKEEMRRKAQVAKAKAEKEKLEQEKRRKEAEKKKLAEQKAFEEAERSRLEQEAKNAALAAERLRIAEEEKKRRSEEAARRKAEAEKRASALKEQQRKQAEAKKKAEEAAKKKKEEQAAAAAAAQKQQQNKMAAASLVAQAAKMTDRPGSASEWAKALAEDPEDDDTNDSALLGGSSSSTGGGSSGSFTSPGAKCTIDGGKQSALFKNYPIYSVQKGDLYAFFNGTDDMMFTATYHYSPSGKMQPLGNTKVSDSDKEKGYKKFVAKVPPGQTVEFARGKPNGWSSSYSCQSASADKEFVAEQKKKSEDEFKNAQSQIDSLKATSPAVDRSASIYTPAGDEKLLAACVEKGVMFIDPQFPPKDTSLSRTGIDSKDTPSCGWARPQSYLPAESHPRLFVAQPEPNDIQQGSLGDCWFCAGMSALAEFPPEVYNIFRASQPFAAGRFQRAKEQEVGAFRVHINKHGWWQNVIVDSYLPTVGAAPCFARNEHQSDELWVAILEKAFAKLHGSYSAIVGGDMCQAVSDLTGAPGGRIDSDDWLKGDGLKAWKAMLKGDQEGACLYIGTPGKDDSAYMGTTGAKNSTEFTARYKKAGLGMGHAYCVLRCEECQGGKLKLLQIRNPWGNATEWTGDWGDDSDLWKKHPDVAKQCDFSAGNDGTFWMTLEDARKYFENVGIVHVKHGWYDYRVRNKFTAGKPEVAVEISVKKPVTMYIQACQMDRRGLKSGHANKNYCSMMIGVANEKQAGKYEWKAQSGSDLEATKPTYMTSRECAMKYTFQPSSKPYLVVVRAYDEKCAKEFVLGLLSDSEVDGENLSVQFRQVPSSNPLFQHYSAWPWGGNNTGALVKADYQIKAPKCAPVTDNNDEILPRWQVI